MGGRGVDQLLDELAGVLGAWAGDAEAPAAGLGRHLAARLLQAPGTGSEPQPAMQAAPAAGVERQPESMSNGASGFHTPSSRQKQCFDA